MDTRLNQFFFILRQCPNLYNSDKLVGGGSILSKATREGLKFIGNCNTIKVNVC